MTHDTKQQRLERLIGAGLSSQPTIKAPASLQQRVLAELARRAALPWWRKSIGHWPVSMRLAFVSTALLAGWILLSGAGRITAPLHGQISWLQSTAAVCAMLGSLVSHVIDVVVLQVPAIWLYGSIAALLLMYVTLAGIGVTVYRSLNNA
jgi:hypothetical protein